MGDALWRGRIAYGGADFAPVDVVMPRPMPYVVQRLRLDPAKEVERVSAWLRLQVGEALHRSGCVVAISGGVDSAVCAALAVRAVGSERVVGLALPERDSDPDSLELARGLAESLGVELIVEDITPTLVACGCYARRDEAIRSAVPGYAAGWRSKLTVDTGSADRLSLPGLVVQPPDGPPHEVRLPPTAFRTIVAASNFKQRVRAMAAYYHADRLRYAVVGTPNRLEYDQGFFVKGGDGLADVKPIAHLYKSQVYALAEFLGVPAAIRSREPTTDTYSLPQTQEEFYFGQPLRQLDLVLHGLNEGAEPGELAAELGLSATAMERAFRDVGRRRSAASYLHAPPIVLPEVRSEAAGGTG